jgi:phage N-6-adenine-methyltransferase
MLLIPIWSRPTLSMFCIKLHEADLPSLRSLKRWPTPCNAGGKMKLNQRKAKCCQRCKAALQPGSLTGRSRRYCSPACRQSASRRRVARSVHFSSKTSEWSTPPELFAELDDEFGFTLDPCATLENRKCDSYFTREDNGLAQRWTGRVFCNPPYGREIGSWMRKALESATQRDCELVVCLVPARTDASWWHDAATLGEVRFLRGRLRFGGAHSGAPFPSAVVVFRNAPERYETGVVKEMTSVA